MDQDTIKLEIVEPGARMFEGQVEMAVIPGDEGDFAVQNGHAPIIASMRPGSLVLFEGGKAVQRFFIAGGFVEFSSDQCRILADAAEDLASLDRAALDQACSQARDEVSLARDDQERQKAERNLALAEQRLDAFDHPVY
ncbi:MAG: ATP synthase F1 subunit epsilon [Pseudomonadota bacterium]